MFDPFMATSNRNIPGCLLGLPSDFQGECDEAIKIFPCQDRILICQTLLTEDDPEPTLSVWELEMEAAKGSDPWRVIHRVPLCEMKAGTTIQDNLNDWREEVHVGEADPYSWKYKRTWVANFFKSLELASPYEVKFRVICVGFHPFDTNVMFLVLCFYRTPYHHTSCLASYDMRTKAIKDIPEDRMPDIFCRFKLFYSLLNSSLSNLQLLPLVFQPWPTLI